MGADIQQCILSKKLDPYTNRCFQIDRDLSKLPSLNEFVMFLENRATALENVNLPESKNFKDKKERVTNLSTKNKNGNSKGDFNKCVFCSTSGHRLYNCKQFQSVPVSERISFVEKQKCCKICLNKHFGRCKYNFECATCHKPHNSLLHLPKQNTDQTKSESENKTETNALEKINCHSRQNNDDVLLPTVRLKIKSSTGEYIFARGLLDSCSQSSFIINDLVKKLNLKTFNDNVSVMGISDNFTKIQSSANVSIESCVHDFKIKVKCSVVNKITSNLPQYEFNNTKINFSKDVQLADPNYNQPGTIDLLLGANVFFQCLLPNSIKLGKNNLILQNTLFGYVASGVVPHNNDKNETYSNFLITRSKLENLVSQFWETEKVPETFFECSSDQDACETIFQNSTELVNNRFQVKLPLKRSIENLNLGNSFGIAHKRFQNLEKRFSNNPELFQRYKQFIDEYVNLNHAKFVDLTEYDLNSGSVYFMAHHPVIREDKKTTKLRVVFDGSMKTNTGISINDVLYNGAVVQNELFDVLTLFRTYTYVLLTDIRQMYRMISLNPEHRKLQNILWRDNPNLPIQCLQLQTVTYGLKSSSFLATRCIVELAKNNVNYFPRASHALINNTYVDDILCGANSVEELVLLKNELIELLKLGSFELHKWCSNNASVLFDIPPEKQNFDEIDINESNSIVKTLGLSYNTISDHFKISSPNFDCKECVTKRQILSFICKFYDPLGFVGPVLVTAKVIMQKLWLQKIKWDEIVPDELLLLWQNFAGNLSNMPTLDIPRNLNFDGASKIELIGFCDSSLIAYGAVLYVRVIFNDKVSVNLLCSKSRIAPINQKLTIPKLELNSSLLLANLVTKVYEILKAKINQVFLYSDSNIVLAWLKTQPAKLNTYVANRVLKIQNLTSKFTWLYVNTKQNPADYLSRGLDPQDINLNKFWFHGPEFLQNLEYDHNSKYKFNFPTMLPEQKVQVLTQISDNQFSFFEQYSNFSTLQRTVAYILRFVRNSKNKNDRYTGKLNLTELENALKFIIKHEQEREFRDEIKCLISKSEIKSNLKSLTPFLDKDNILRVGGRLHNANIPYDHKHPIILPKNNHVTNLIIVKEHLRLLHAGPKQVLSSLNLKFWLINSIREIKKNLHKCVTCFKAKAKCSEQLMGSLPKDRVNFSRPFQHVGVDFCGPFYIKQSRLRKTIVSKAYVALFVCFSVKAVHMELLSDLTTENFLASFKRFIFRRGKPTEVYCDNGSTFKGANNQINEHYKFQQSNDHQNKVNHYCSEEKIKFNFIPSYSPVFGGLWEAGVKSAKYHLKRTMGNNQLTYEQLNTLIIEIEGILNSRPITQISSDPLDLTYLTPGHFLIGTSITSFPEPDLNNVPQNRLKFWKLCTQMQQHFWQRWHKDYLSQLQNRPKWQRVVENVKDGMLVLLKDDNIPSLKWPMARIIKVIPGKDGKVRVVQVRTQNGIYTRSITKIAVLPIY